jgi:hypothetical protein
MSKLDDIRDALVKKPQLLVDLLDILQKDPPLIGRPWQPGSDKTAWVRKDVNGKTILFVIQTAKDHPEPTRRGTWYITGSSGWGRFSRSIKELPFSESREEAMRVADAFLTGRDWTLLEPAHKGTLGPWQDDMNGSRTRCNDDNRIIGSVSQDGVVWKHSQGHETYISRTDTEDACDRTLLLLGWTLEP